MIIILEKLKRCGEVWSIVLGIDFVAFGGGCVEASFDLRQFRLAWRRVALAAGDSAAIAGSGLSGNGSDSGNLVIRATQKNN